MPEGSFKPSPTIHRAAEQSPDLADRLGLPKTAPRSDRPKWRNRLLQSLKTLLWVAPLTVLLWVYAEQEKLGKLNDVRVRIEVRSASTDRIVTLISPREGELRLDLEGPTASLEDVRSRITDPRSKPLEIVVNDPPGYEGDVSIADRLNSNPAFAREAVVVKRAEPVVRIRVEQRVRRDVQLLVRSEQKPLANLIEPRMITVDGPESELGGGRSLAAYVDVSALAGKAPGAVTDDLPVTLYDLSRDRPLESSLVNYSRVLRTKVEIPTVSMVPYEIKRSIRLDMRLPASIVDGDEYEIKLPDVNITNVQLSGPEAAIQQVAKGFAVSATLKLTLEEIRDAVDKGPQVKRLKSEDYSLPEGVKVTNPAEVKFTVRRRPQG